VDLSKATVDTQSLGLTGYGVQTAAVGASFFTTYGGNSGSTSQLTFEGAGFSDASAVSINVNTVGVGDVNSLVAAINAGIQAAGQGGTPQAAAFKAANIVASADSSGHINFTSSSNAFMVTDDGTNQSQALLSGATGAAVYDYAHGTYRNNTTGLAWQAALGGSDTQKLTFQAVDSTGALQKLDVTIPNSAALSDAVADINQQLQASNLSALQKIVAVQDGTSSLGFTSPVGFNVTIQAATTSTNGITAPAGTLSATQIGSETGTNAAIDTIGGATAAVSALANAVANLGTAQGAVGKGENMFNYAINLAQSQLTNFSTAESRIRDADLANEAANLTKAQVLMQAGVAALAQANAAPQAVLSLLKS